MSKDGLDDQIRELRVTVNDYIDVSLESERKKRAENIQVLVSLGIIGAFFTSQFQSLISGTSFELFAKLVVVSSGIFLLSKVTFPTIRLTRNSSKLEWFDQFGMQFFYMFSVVLGSLTMVYLWMPPLSTLVPVIKVPKFNYDLVFKTITIVFSIISALLVALQHRMELKQMEEKEERLESSISRPKEIEIVDKLAANPEKIRKDIEIIEREALLGEKCRPDFIAKDKEDTTLVIEVKRIEADEKAVSQLEEYVKEYKSQKPEETVRGVLVAPSIHAKAKKALDEKDWDFIKIRLGDFL